MDEADPLALIEAAAWMIRNNGVSYLEAKSQVQDIFRDAWETAAMVEQLLANLDPITDSLH
jgi:hypothetical protein